ncbi:MAG: Uncharacterized protein XD58_1400 [Thermotoga sp. 50_1627]|uniref:DUF6092 family protein n=1 Tax=Pseudothermotoga sp. TaxID=2033661 RepID=UPI00076C0ABD|nr:MAG: Uncharacterized protein XD45_1453 [Thermotoga sp. 50_64]KUK24613.1 MAG: Uncharacterized protein XD58_1400 [Thermotoga sp. 50_1627]MBC7117132.1 nitroreductase family protein [Pseudothermotoga sp.]
MNVKEAIFGRRSVREFTEEPVDASTLKEIMLAGIYAPSAGNLQPWQFYCYTSPKAIKTIKSASPGILGSPQAIIVACVDEDKLKKLGLKEWRINAVLDIGMACQNMMLRAFELGVGTCPVTSFDPDLLRALLELPETHNPVLLVAVGHYKAIPPTPHKDESVIHLEEQGFDRDLSRSLEGSLRHHLTELLGFLITSVRISMNEPSNYAYLRLLEAAVKVCESLERTSCEGTELIASCRRELQEAVTLYFRADPSYLEHVEKVIGQYAFIQKRLDWEGI